MTSIERVAELAASILDQAELEAWAMRSCGMTFREMHQLYRDDPVPGPTPSISTIHAAYKRAERKLRAALEAQAA